MCCFHYDPPTRIVEFMIIITGITYHSRILTCLTGIFEHIYYSYKDNKVYYMYSNITVCIQFVFIRVCMYIQISS